MATVTWLTPGTDGVWSVGTNWDNTTGPAATDDVSIGGNAASYTVTLDFTPTPALDSLTLGSGLAGSVTLSLGANSLDVTGAGAGFTDTITLNETGGATISLGGGAITAATLNLNTANALVVGFGTLTFTSFVVGSGNIVADSGTLDITGGGLLSNGITFGLNDGATLKVDDALPGGALFAFSAGDITDSTLAVSNVGAVTETIANMNVAATLAATDKIDFIGKTVSVTGSTGQTGTAGTVTLFDGTNTINLNMSGLSAANWFPDTASDGAGGTVLFFSQVACYARGTRILTEAGEVPVEDLSIGDSLVTFSGVPRPIRWIGTRAYDGRFIAGNREVLPIRVAAGALSEGVPARDLFVSPAHSLYFDDVLVPAEHLVNGVTIEQAQEVDWLEYFHIELDAHDVIFAEGAPAETYVDCDNRGMFQNGADYALLYPGDEPPHWEFCAPRLEWDSEELTAIRARLLDRAAALTAARDRDPILHLVVDGKTIWPASVDDRRYRFIVPAGSDAVWLGSRSTVPAEIAAESRDIRRLGVPVERIALSDGEMSVEISHSHAALRDGFHPDEGSHRWTDGLARLPESWLGVLAGDFTLEVQLAPSSLDYRVEPLQAAA